MTKQYDYVVYIGRFQPFHIGHYHSMRTAYQNADNVIVLLGSANTGPSYKNPFNWMARKHTIQRCFPDVLAAPIDDYTYDDEKWVNQVVDSTWDFIRHREAQRLALHGRSDFKIAVIYGGKADTTWYADLLPPEWGRIEITESIDLVNGSTIRELMAAGKDQEWINYVPHTAVPGILTYMDRGAREVLMEEKKCIDQARRDEAKYPWDINAVTADAVVFHKGKVLLIIRKKFPGKDQLAFPGGFKNKNENLLTAMKRELREETGIDLDDGTHNYVIRGSFIADNPSRSSRGTVVGFVYVVDILDEEEPKVVAADDAAGHMWLTQRAVDMIRYLMFEDHHVLLTEVVELFKNGSFD
jgi:bifunctional NMN adenylyltransferase/nudix hydrolase